MRCDYKHSLKIIEETYKGRGTRHIIKYSVWVQTYLSIRAGLLGLILKHPAPTTALAQALEHWARIIVVALFLLLLLLRLALGILGFQTLALPSGWLGRLRGALSFA